ncbi:MAG: hypothetical protein AB4041_10575 [Microcystaceae cyanobacterium]
MLTKITLTNFKCFREATEFPLSKVNLLTGINRREKSTLLQSLLLMRQSVDQSYLTKEIFLNGHYVRLGTFQDILNSHSTQNSNIIFNYQFTTLLSNDKIDKHRLVQDILEYRLSKQEQDDMVAKLDRILYSYYEINHRKLLLKIFFLIS